MIGKTYDYKSSDKSNFLSGKGYSIFVNENGTLNKTHTIENKLTVIGEYNLQKLLYNNNIIQTLLPRKLVDCMVDDHLQTGIQMATGHDLIALSSISHNKKWRKLYDDVKNKATKELECASLKGFGLLYYHDDFDNSVLINMRNHNIYLINFQNGLFDSSKNDRLNAL